VEDLWQDARFGLRMLAKTPGFTIVALLTLTLGIGANTAIFSIVNAVVLNPLPFPHSDQLVIIHESKPNFEHGSVSYPNFKDWRDQNHSFSSMATANGYFFSLTGMGQAEQLKGEHITADFFETLGVTPILGRTITRAEEQPGAGPVVLISEGLWKRRFGGTPDVLGKRIQLEGKGYTIVGVIPASFHLSAWSLASGDVYVPMGQWDAPWLKLRSAGMGMRVVARLKPGVTMDQANADMARVTANLAAAYPDANNGISARLEPLKETIVGNVRPFLLVLLVAVGFVLLIACVNVASLMLARSTARMREFAVRMALGASRRRVIRQLLTESLVLSVAAGALGLGLAVWGTHAAIKWLPENLPRADEIGVDFRVLLFTMASSLGAGALFGLLPALKTSQADPQVSLRDGGRGVSGARHRAQGIFVIAETSFALVLLIGAGLMIRSLGKLWAVNPGFDAHNVLSFGYTFPPSMIGGNPDAIRTAYRAFDEKLAAEPGIKAVSQVWGGFPLDSDDETLFWLQGEPRPADDNSMKWTLTYEVGPGYFRLMGIPLLRGRFFSEGDDEKSPHVAVVDDVFAKQYFPGRNPIGQSLELKDNDSKAQSVEIVGIVGHVKQWGLDADDTHSLRAEMYTPWMQAQDSFVKLAPSGISGVVRYEGTSAEATAAIRRVLGEMSSDQIIYYSHTVEESITDSLAERRFVMILLVAFAGLALLLAAIGIYGVISYLAGQRTQEIGIRMALGAQRLDVLRQMLWEGVRLALTGAVLGVVASLALTRLMTKVLFGISATDPMTFAAVVLTLLLVALAACSFPAWKATRVDPMQALRSE
jgi:predicted permease